MTTVAIVGAGDVGGAAAHALAAGGGVGRLQLIDREASAAAGKALDQVGFKLLAAGMATCLSDPAKAAKAGFDPEEVEKLFLKLA